MKTFLKVWLLSLLLLFSTTGKSFGQSENMRFEHLTEQQGLSQNTVWSIHQDKEGFMWFGTEDGLNKYDGYNFTVLKPDPDDPEHTLHHNIISDIHEDRKGRLWVTTLGGGLHLVDKYTGKVTRYGIKPTNTVIWNGLASIYEDQKGLLWISGYGGVASFNPETKRFTLYPVPPDIVWLTSVTQDAAGQIWVSGSGGVYRLNRSTGKYTPFVLDSSLTHQPDCWSLYLDKKGILWAGTNVEGLFYLNTHRSPWHFTRYNPKDLISKSFRFNSIYEDKQENLWLSGSDGLQRIIKKTDEVFNLESNPFQSGNLIRNNVSTIYQDRTGTLWIGTDNGIHKVKGQTRNFLTYQIIPTLPSVIRHENSISTLLEDYTGKIWLGSAGSTLNENFENGLFQFDPQNKNIKHFPADASHPGKLTSNKVWSLFEDRI
ncbi:MAG: hypothetical protein M3142_15290, partial [Bacteroidota bacterium]|nr:hypothetical protein [Bacteroidota bacterium]